MAVGGEGGDGGEEREREGSKSLSALFGSVGGGGWGCSHDMVNSVCVDSVGGGCLFM